MLQAAKLYYIESLPQHIIADQLGISRPTLIKMLHEARRIGIVEIKICDPKKRVEYAETRQRLIETLGIGDVVFAPDLEDEATTAAPNEALYARLGAAAAEYLLQVLKSNAHIGLGWGRSVEETVRQITHRPGIRNLDIVPILGGPGTSSSFSHLSNSICEAFAKNFLGSKVHYLYAPLYAETPAAQLAYLEQLTDIFEKFHRLDVVVVGLGAASDSLSPHNPIYPIPQIAASELSAAAGDICGRFFDLSGRFCSPKLEELTIAISPDQLKKTASVVVVAGGEKKRGAILGAANAGLMDVLITDLNTAKCILA
jgi:deoxyribonucleoside regulator